MHTYVHSARKNSQLMTKMALKRQHPVLSHRFHRLIVSVYNVHLCISKMLISRMKVSIEWNTMEKHCTLCNNFVRTKFRKSYAWLKYLNISVVCACFCLFFCLFFCVYFRWSYVWVGACVWMCVQCSVAITNALLPDSVTIRAIHFCWYVFANALVIMSVGVCEMCICHRIKWRIWLTIRENVKRKRRRSENKTEIW